MLSPDDLDTLPDAALELWRQVEEDILADMARRLSKMGGITETAVWQAQRLEATRFFRRDLVKRLAQILGKSEAEVRKLLVQAGTQALAADDEIYRAAGLYPPPVNDSPALVNLLNAGARQTNGTMANLTATTANTATGQFERALDRAWLQTASGAFDYQTAVRRCISDLAAAGLEAVRYPTGHTDTLEVAVRRAVVTGINQSACKLQIERCRELGCDLVEVTAHAGARPEHAAWQGKIYSISGEHPKYPPLSETGYGTGAALEAAVCHGRGGGAGQHPDRPPAESGPAVPLRLYRRDRRPGQRRAHHGAGLWAFSGRKSYMDRTQKQSMTEHTAAAHRAFSYFTPAPGDYKRAAARPGLAGQKGQRQKGQDYVGLAENHPRRQLHRGH